jgi:hypothetical protein
MNDVGMRKLGGRRKEEEEHERYEWNVNERGKANGNGCVQHLVPKPKKASAHACSYA